MYQKFVETRHKDSKRLKLWGPVVNFHETQMISQNEKTMCWSSQSFFERSFKCPGGWGKFLCIIFWLFYILGMFGVDKEKHEKRSGFVGLSRPQTPGPHCQLTQQGPGITQMDVSIPWPMALRSWRDYQKQPGGGVAKTVNQNWCTVRKPRFLVWRCIVETNTIILLRSNDLYNDLYLTHVWFGLEFDGLGRASLTACTGCSPVLDVLRNWEKSTT